MKKKLLISLLATVGLLVVAVTTAYLIVLVRKPMSNSVNILKTTKKPATTTNIVNAFNAGSYDESLKLANDYLQKHPKDAQAWAAKATILANKGSVEFKENTYGQQAIEAANKALAIDPQLPEGFYARGYAYEIQNQFEQAKSDYDKVLKMTKDNPTYLNQMGHLNDLMGKPEEAKKYYEQALAVNPDFGKALVNMGRYELRYGDKIKAKSYFEKSLPVIDNNMDKAGVYYSLGMLDLNQNKLQEGYKYMQQAVKMAPKYPQALIGRGWAGMLLMTADGANLEELMKEGLTFETVFGDVNKAVEINPSQTVGYLTLARMHLKLPFLADKSLDYYDQALAVVDKDITVMSNNREDFKNKILEEKKGAEKVLQSAKKTKKINKKETGYLYEIQEKYKNKIKHIKEDVIGKSVFAKDVGVWRGNCWIGDKSNTDVCFDETSYKNWKILLSLNGHKINDIDKYNAYCMNGSPIILIACGSNSWKELAQRPTTNLCVNGSVIWKDKVANDRTWDWQCYDPHSEGTLNCAATRSHSCLDSSSNPSATPPSGGTACSDTTTGLTVDVSWHKVTNCTGATKCAYTKKAECGPANGNSYETKSALENAGLCSNGFIMTNFNDTSGVPGGGWDWKCEKAGYDTNSCSAKKTGECKPAPNNVTLNNACSNGKLNSIYFDFDETKFTWACGTLENGQPSNPTSHLLYNGSISGYKFQNQPVSDTIEKHSTGGNQDCTCTPAYVYTCPVTISADCSSKCEQWAEEEHKPFKKDNNCFTNVSGDFINEVEYETATGKKCLNQQIKCPPCGVTNGGSDTVIEVN